MNTENLIFLAGLLSHSDSLQQHSVWRIYKGSDGNVVTTTQSEGGTEVLSVDVGTAQACPMRDETNRLFLEMARHIHLSHVAYPEDAAYIVPSGSTDGML